MWCVVSSVGYVQDQGVCYWIVVGCVVCVTSAVWYVGYVGCGPSGVGCEVLCAGVRPGGNACCNTSHNKS